MPGRGCLVAPHEVRSLVGRLISKKDFRQQRVRRLFELFPGELSCSFAKAHAQGHKELAAEQ